MRAQCGTFRYFPDPLGFVTIRLLHDQPLHVILSERSESKNLLRPFDFAQGDIGTAQGDIGMAQGDMIDNSGRHKRVAQSASLFQFYTCSVTGRVWESAISDIHVRIVCGHWPLVGRADGQCVHSAVLFVTALTRSVS